MLDVYTQEEFATEINMPIDIVVDWCKKGHISDAVLFTKYNMWLIPKYWKNRFIFSNSIVEASHLFVNMKNNLRDELQKNKLLIDTVKKEIFDLFSRINDGHGMEHLIRVMNYSLLIQTYSGGDSEVLIVASLLHDLHRYIQKIENRYVSPEESIDLVKSIIGKFVLTSNQINKIIEAIINHENYYTDAEYRNRLCIESLIVQDADKIDAIGATGIVRTFQYGASHNVPDYDPNVDFYQSIKYIDGIDDASTIHHVYNKLVRVEEWLHTDIAKIIISDSQSFMKGFISRYITEWNFSSNG